MHEGVAARDRRVWPFGHAGRSHHAASPSQFLAKLLDFQDVAIHRPRHQQRREVRSRCTRDFEQTSLLGGQVIDLPHDHLPQIARHTVLRNRFLSSQEPLSVDLDDRPLRDEMVDKGDDEQRLSAGSRKDPLHQLLGQVGRAEPQSKVVLDFGPLGA